MTNYTLKISGWELNASAHSLTHDEVDHVYDYQEEMGIDDLSEIGTGLEDIIDGYDPFDTNMWVISKPMDISDKTWFTVDDEDGNNILDFAINKIDEVNEDIILDYDYPKPLQGYPEEDHNENILLYLEENKGLVCNFNFKSNTIPTIDDFTYESSCIETPDGDWDFVNKVFYKGKELDMEYDEQWVRGKALTVELWTMDDIEE